MKVTRSQLRQIIKEELSRIVEVADNDGDGKLSADELRNIADELESPGAYQPGESALTDIASAIDDIIDNAVGRVDLDFSDDPLTKKDILDFVARMIHEQR